MESLYNLKHELANFITNNLKYELKFDDIDNLNIDIDFDKNNPELGYKILVGNWNFKIKSEAKNIFISALESNEYEQLNALANIIININDKSISAFPFIAVENDAQFTEGLIAQNFIGIDERFDRLYNLIHTEFQHIAKNVTIGAECYNRDVNKIKDKDIYIHFNTKEHGEKTEFFITCGLVPGINKSSLSLQESASIRINDSLKPMTEDMKDELFNYPAANKQKAQVGITVKDELNSSLDRINDAIKKFITNKDVEKSLECFDYAVNKINGILIPLIATLQLEPYGFFGGTGENIFDPETPSLNSNACAELIDEAITALFKHLESIPKVEGIDHFAIDRDNFGIYGRNEKLVVINQVVDYHYTFSTVFEPYYSIGFLEVFKRYLKTIKNKYVFSQIGKIDESSITSIKD